MKKQKNIVKESNMKKYKVELSNWSEGKSKYFWFRKNALKYIEVEKENWLWINLTNNWTKKVERIKSTNTSEYYRNEKGEYLKKYSKRK